MAALLLPAVDGGLYERALRPATAWARPSTPLTSRHAYAAAHVIPSTTAENTSGAPARLDWDATLAYRHELWSYGLGVADAMDTAQRGMGLDWAATQELIRRSAQEAAAVVASGQPALAGKTVRDLLACGAGTDQLDPADVPDGEAGLAVVLEAYREQLAVVSGSGAKVILMASRALARVARGPEDYLRVYSTLLREATEPVILHWLGTMFDPALAGYWGADDVAAATETFVGLIRSHPDAVDGVKVSLLDAAHEVALRAALPDGVRLYTGDDFNYPELIDGDGERHSDALLGVFAAIYPAASAALQAYDAGRPAEARGLLDSTRELGRQLFSAPTFYYKTGIAFLSWLNGSQPGFQMVGGLHSGRSVPHLVRTLELADEAGLLLDPELAAARMTGFLSVNGVIL
ncbi:MULTISPECIES: dihydrodipicolinate synthase family protein [Arthrobacter]|uniref:Dihydrodipicolinate synthase family protein n=2 Tax=Arthrobacter TaxID=1663 RepID=A0ABU9KLW0_9MICC|nr:dihydrodipicolinate synthase family protein [Arthrobacter sp. YJM1]MDP5228179.1 dihydrodipicolinate synthase family protein [Arthrobacter sp. YJM1]